jgi:CO dehydrogenase maturation factor
MKIAVSGKGGVGKTLVAGVLACFFAARGLKVIAIDADPSPNLALTLGLPAEEARKIVPISENESLISRKTGTHYSGVYRLAFTVDDVVKEYAVATPMGVYLILMGTVKSAGSGCTCPANAVIRALLRHLILERDEVVLLDMEAGVEHLGRGTAKHVDVMLVIADSSLKSLETAKHIHKLASDAGIRQVFLVGNRVADGAQRDAIEQYARDNGLSLLGHVPFDEEVMKADMIGTTPLKRQGSVAVQTIEKLGARLLQSEQ